VRELLARIRAARRYPELARRRELEGIVRVSFVVGGDGHPRDVHATHGADPLLDEAAIDAVKRAAPLPVVDGPVEVELDFRLDAQAISDP
jgi:protein TonB